MQRKPVTVRARTGVDLLDVLENTADRRRNTGQLESNVAERRGTRTSWRVVASRNGPLLSMPYDDDDGHSY